MCILLIGCSYPFILLFLLAIIFSFLTDFINAEDLPSVSRKCGTKLSSKIIPVFPKIAITMDSSNNLQILSHDTSNIAKDIRATKPFDKNLDKKPKASKHYSCPPTSIDILRRRYGTNKSLWGEWSNSETRQFYKSQLPKPLQIEGALGLTLEERAKLASAARHAVRMYSRERCHLPGRILAELYDGFRHLHSFGYWKSDGMSWDEIKNKYLRQARAALGADASESEIELLAYKKVLERSCATNLLFDGLAKADDNNNNNNDTGKINRLNKSGKISTLIGFAKYPASLYAIQNLIESFGSGVLFHSSSI